MNAKKLLPYITFRVTFRVLGRKLMDKNALKKKL